MSALQRIRAARQKLKAEVPIESLDTPDADSASSTDEKGGLRKPTNPFAFLDDDSGAKEEEQEESDNSALQGSRMHKKKNKNKKDKNKNKKQTVLATTIEPDHNDEDIDSILAELGMQATVDAPTALVDEPRFDLFASDEKYLTAEYEVRRRFGVDVARGGSADIDDAVSARANTRRRPRTHHARRAESAARHFQLLPYAEAKDLPASLGIFSGKLID